MTTQPGRYRNDFDIAQNSDSLDRLQTHSQAAMTGTLAVKAHSISGRSDLNDSLSVAIFRTFAKTAFINIGER
jgi:hypothetical protein